MVGLKLTMFIIVKMRFEVQNLVNVVVFVSVGDVVLWEGLRDVLEHCCQVVVVADCVV